MLTLHACFDDSGDFVTEQKVSANEVSVHFLLQIGENSSLRSGGDELEGTSDENKIKTLTFFVIDIKSNNDLDWSRVKYVPMLAPSSPTTTPIEVSVRTNPGKKCVYVGANMSVAQITSFCANKGRYTVEGNTYKDVINDFTNSSRGFVMFGQMKSKSSSSFVIEVTEGDELIETKVDLSRVVSKVALTYTPDTKEGYATIANGIGGFIDADSIYFMLNATSKSIDFIPGTTPRYVMSEYIAESADPAYETLYHYITDPTKDFMFYTPQGEVLGITGGSNFFTATSQLPIEIPLGGDNPYHQGLEKYIAPSENSVELGKHTHYSSSWYCLENTVSSAGFEPPSDIKELRKGINTQVIVVAKYIPEIIHHYDSDIDADNLVSCYPSSGATNREDIHDAMEAITNNDADPNGPYTFYAVQIPPFDPLNPRYEYYTYDAKKYMEDVLHDPQNFITYKGGYGYYFTFVSQNKPIAEDKYYNLKRNNYYILNVEKFIPPGAVYPQQLYMLINSETVEWSFQKTIDVSLD